MNELVLYDAARKALSESLRTDEVKGILDKAKQYEAAARVAKDKSPTGQHCTFPAVSTYGVGFSEKLLCFDAICGLEAYGEYLSRKRKGKKKK